MQESLVFISPKCKFCSSLISLINTNESLKNKIQVVNIHTLNKIPQNMNTVPAIICEKTLYQGNEAFQWVNKIISQSQESNKTTHINDPEALCEFDNDCRYSSLDCEKTFSNNSNYSFIDDKNADIHNMTYISQPDKYDENEINESSLNGQMEQLMNLRKIEEDELTAKQKPSPI